MPNQTPDGPDVDATGDDELTPPPDLQFGSSSAWFETLAADSSAPQPSPLVPRWLGKRVGRFRLVSLLGKGAYGRVFLADDIDLQRRVALKIITAEKTGRTVQSEIAHEALSSSEARDAAKRAVERMITEARAATRIEHPGVVQIYEIGWIGQERLGGYIAMELLDGGTLQDLVNAAGPMDVARACALIADAAEALHYGHSLEVIHRDVKPANLMLNRHGRCKIADFGQAFVNEPSDSRNYASIVGTALYLAPEIILGRPADAKSDQYSLAATLFTLLAGRPPFVGERQKVLAAHVSAPPPDLRPSIDPRLNEILAKGMSKDPAERFETIEQFGQAVRQFSLAPAENPAVAAAEPDALAGAAVEDSSLSWTGLSADPTERISPTQVDDTHIAPRRGPRWPWILSSAAAVILLLGLGLWLASLFADDAGGIGNGQAMGNGVSWQSDGDSWAKEPDLASAGITGDDAAAEVVPVTDYDRLLRIAHGEDKAFPSRRATVDGIVAEARTGEGGDLLSISFEKTDPGRAFQVFCQSQDDLFRRMEETFGGRNGAGLRGKRIRVSGELILRDNAPCMVITSPQQIQVIEGNSD